jgi:hypothetical protein
MTARDKAAILARAVAEGRSVIRTHIALAAGCVVFGIGVAAVIMLTSGEKLAEQSRWVLSVASSMLSMGLGAAFPLKEIFARRQSVNTLTWLQSYYETRADEAQTPASADAARVEKLFWDFVGKTL